MATLIAKPVIKDQYWVVTDGERKVGNVVANGTGFEVKIHGNKTQFDDTTSLTNKTNIEFQTIKTIKTRNQSTVVNHPIFGKMYNTVIEVKRKINLFTKTPKSKCYFAVGWFAVKLHGDFEAVMCPKYIFIQRYPYVGPFDTKQQVIDHINTSNE